MQHIEPQETRYIEAGDVEVHTAVNRARGPLEYSLAYYNHLNQDVTITLRNGVPFKLPAGSGRKNCFEVLATFSIDPHVGIDPKSVFHNGTSVSPESLALRAALEHCEQSGRFNRKSFTLKYSVPAEQVEKNSGVIYIADLDLTVSVSSDERRAIHPYSPSSDRYRLIEAEANVNNPERFGYSLYLISNNGAIMDKYINIGGRVYRVPSIKNKSLRDGVYLCSSGCVEAKGNDPIPVTEYYTPEQAIEQLRLYDDPETARNHGDVLAVREQELKDLQFQYKALEHDQKMERLKYEHDVAVRKQEVEGLKLEQEQQFAREEHERKMRSMRDKEYYDMRQSARKDSNELVKFIPVMLTGVIAIAAAISKHSKA